MSGSAKDLNKSDTERSYIKALKCAFDITNVSTAKLSAHVGISYGNLSVGILGGYENNWIYILNGYPLVELAKCLDDAASKEVVVSEKFFQNISDNAFINSAVKMESSNYKLSFQGAYDKNNYNSSRKIMNTPDLLIVNQLSPFIPKPVTDAISSGFVDNISELREICTVFISLDTFSMDTHNDPLSLQEFYVSVQEKVATTGGYIRQFLVDDKGCVLILMWGVPHFSYPNNCSRALACILSIGCVAKLMGHVISVGTTVGTCCCTSLGSKSRRDYVIIGCSVNLSARLMSKAKGKILVDKKFYNQLPISSKKLMSKVDDLSLKGVSGPVSAYSMAQLHDIELSLSDDLVSKRTILRRALANYLSASIDKLLPTASHMSSQASFKMANNSVRIVDGVRNESNLPPPVSSKVENPLSIFLLGPSGSGKSTAANFLIQAAVKRKIKYYRLVLRNGDEIKTYGSIVKLIEDLIGVEHFHNPTDRENAFRNTCQKVFDKSMVEPSVSSLNHFYENHKTTEKTTALSSGSIDSVLYSIVSFFLKLAPSILVIENSEFCDEPSWRILSSIMKSKLKMLILATIHTSYRQVEAKRERKTSFSVSKSRFESILSFNKSNLEVDFNDFTFLRNGSRFYPCDHLLVIFRNANTNIIEIKGMNEDEVEQILVQVLHTSNIPNDLVKLVLEVSSGNPFWIKSIANYVKNFGAQKFLSNVSDIDIKDSLHFLIVWRIEQLSFEQQAIIKYASIFGEQFQLNLLYKILPIKLRENFDKNIEILKEQSLIYCLTEDLKWSIYIFQNDLIRTTIYQLFPKSNAAQLHVQIANLIQTLHFTNLKPYYSVISMHYIAAENNKSLAFKFTVKAADYALSVGNYTDSLTYSKLAKTLISNEKDFEILLSVVTFAVKDIKMYFQKNMRRFSLRIFSSNTDSTAFNRDVLVRFREFLNDLLSEKSNWPKEDELAVNIKPDSHSHRKIGYMAWQPSFVSKTSVIDSNESDDDSIMNEPLVEENAASTFKNSCIIL